MSQSSLPTDWVNRFTDPFALLGIAVTADDKRVQRRYKAVAKRLHPDCFVGAEESTREYTGQVFARLVNPAYEKLQQEKGRKEHLALLRLKVRRITREGPLTPQSDLARQLMEHPASNVDVFYEQAIAQLAETQFNPYDQFEFTTQQLEELNLVYLQLKIGDIGVGVTEKRTGLVAAQEVRTVQFTPPPTPEVATESYDQRHYRRAQQYCKKGAWDQAIQELREAIKIKADKSEYHALLGVAYLQKNLPGVAKAYINRALALNPKDTLAIKFAAKVGIKPVATQGNQTNGKANHANGQNGTAASSAKPAKRGGLFGLFRSRK